MRLAVLEAGKEEWRGAFESIDRVGRRFIARRRGSTICSHAENVPGPATAPRKETIVSRSLISRSHRVALSAIAIAAFVAAPVHGVTRGADAAAPGDIVINEIMQNPSAVSDAAGEWFELYNATAVPISLDGWKIESGGSESHTISSGGTLVIPAGGFVALGKNGTPATNGGYTPAYVYPTISLGNGSDILVIRQSGVAIDSVAWDDGATFPDPDGGSMELIDPLSDNRIGTSWAANTTTPYGAGDFGTPGAPNANTVDAGSGPTITNVSHVPAAPIETDSVRIRAEVTDNLGIEEVCVEFRVNGGSATAAMMTLTTGAIYETKLAPRPAGTTVSYIIVARDVDGNVALSPANAPTETYSYSVGSFALTISLNEVLADPPTSSGDPLQGDVNRDGEGDSFEDEFIELVNFGTQPVEISGWTISDDDAPGAEFVFPAGTIVPSMGFVTLFGGGSPQGFSGLVFVDDGRIGNGLGNTGETVELKRDGILVDVLVYGAEAGNNESLIRVPDGTGIWTRPGEQGFLDPYSPQAPNGGGFIANEITTWGKIKAVFR